MKACALALLLLFSMSCSGECFVVDQEEDGLAVVVFDDGHTAVVPGVEKEGTRVCGAHVTRPAETMARRRFPALPKVAALGDLEGDEDAFR